MRKLIGVLSACFAVALIITVPATASPGARGPAPAQKVLKNGFIYTVDSRSSVASAVAIRGGKFVYVGGDAGVRRFIGPNTRVVDLKGRMALPGFVDSHLHFTNGGIADLYEVQIPQGMPTTDYPAFIEAFADAHPDLAAIRGWGWDISQYIPPVSTHGPLKETLDAVVSDRPVALQDSSLHNIWCNSKALELAGITKDTPDPPGGYIERDPVSGEPTGTVYEAASELVTNALPQYTVAQYKAAITHFQKDVAAHVGLTTVFDPRLLIGANSAKALQQLAEEGKLTIRVRGALLMDPEAPLGPQLQAAAAERSKHKNALVQDQQPQVLHRRRRLLQLHAGAVRQRGLGRLSGRLPRLLAVDRRPAQGRLHARRQDGVPAALPRHRRRGREALARRRAVR